MNRAELHIEQLNDHNFYGKKVKLDGDAGIDLYFPNSVRIPPGETLLIDFEIKCNLIGIYYADNITTAEYQESESYMLVPRSSIFRTPLRQSNSIGIIDAGYRGHIMVPVDNRSTEDYVVKQGERLFQLLHPSLQPIHIKIVDGHKETARGEGGLGSTGK